MTIKIYNTLTRNKETFQPLEQNTVKMYVCGPTVYDYIHIGNARPLIFFDVVRRFLQQQQYQVTYIVNFTDVDDKLIRKAEQTGSTVPEVAERYITAFYEDIEQLGVRKADANPRVTENMSEIIAFIEDLVARDFAYENSGESIFVRRSSLNMANCHNKSLTTSNSASASKWMSAKKTLPTLCSGNVLKLAKFFGLHLGVMGDQAGISNARRWSKNTLA